MAKQKDKEQELKKKLKTYKVVIEFEYIAKDEEECKKLIMKDNPDVYEMDFQFIDEVK